MNTELSPNRQTPEVSLGQASLNQLIPRSKIGHFSRDSIICTGDQLGGCTYLVLKGRCALRCASNGDGSRESQIFNAGESFGGGANSWPAPPDSEIVALQDSVVLAVRAEDIENLREHPVNGHEAAPEKIAESNTSFYFNRATGSVVGLVCLSDSLPIEHLSEALAKQLQTETQESVILVQFGFQGSARSTTAGQFDHELDGLATLPGELYRDESGLYRLRLQLPGQTLDAEIFGELFRKLRRRFRYVIAAIMAERFPSSYLFRCVMRSDVTHFLLRPTAEDLYGLDLLLHELRLRLNRPAAVELKSILCLAKGEPIGDFDNRIISTGIPSPELIRECPTVTAGQEPLPADAKTGLFQTDIRRVARIIGKCLVGLALSSGGAKGLAHIGVIQVLEENGIDVDVVAGASMGAYVGAIWAYGLAGDKLEELAREMELKRAMWTLVDPVVLPRQGFMRGYAVKRRLQKTIGSAQFADLARSLRVVASHLDTMERVVFSTGDVATAVHASIAVPGICTPVRIGDDLYVDGGIVDPLPTDVLREMGVRKIIAVNTIPTPERIRYCMQIEHELARSAPAKSHSLIRRFLPHRHHVNHYAHSNILDILMHSTHGAQMRVAEANSRHADVVLQPDICDDRWLDFRNPGFYIKAGREIALRHFEEIKALIQKKGASHEHEPPPQKLAEPVPA